MSIILIAQLIGIFSILLLFTIKLYIVIDYNRFIKYGRTAMLWTIIYIYFLTVLRILNYMELVNTEQIRIISGFSSLVPLIAILGNYFYYRSIKINDSIR